MYESANIHVDICDLFSVRKTSDRDAQSRLRNELLHPAPAQGHEKQMDNKDYISKKDTKQNCTLQIWFAFQVLF